MSSNVPISLDPSNGLEAEQELNLGLQISRVTQERGSFAELSESELLNGTDKPADNVEDEAAMEVETEPPQEAKDEETASFSELRQQLLAKVGTALNEAALNLDFVSLLVSASRPQAGGASISPMLKSQTPLASLNAEAIEAPASTIPSVSAYGWKVKAYRRSANSLSEAAKRLSQETQKEAQFWRDVLNTTSKGEVINRKLQVVYGYHDSGSTYYDRGTGSIKRDEVTGRAVFKPSSRTARKLVQVSVFADGGEASNDSQTPEPERLVGRSVLPYFDLVKDLEEPLRSVRLERNNLFEHELMFQLIQEAREKLASHRVKLKDGGKIVCELFGGRIELDLVDANLSSTDDENPSTTSTNPAYIINLSLHLLLTQRFRSNLEKQHETPKPLNSRVEPRDEAAAGPYVLQPILAYVHHSILVARTLKLVQVMLPDAKVSSETITPCSLFSEPKCLYSVDHNDTKISIEIRSPVNNANDPMVVVSAGSRSTEIYDLTELELWLKWVTRTTEKN